MEEILIKDEYLIPFKYRTDRYGRAEFEFCTIFKKGKITDLFITPRQQPDLEQTFHYKPDTPFSNNISFAGYQSLDEPRIWMIYYCQLHKTQCIRLYVPNDAKYLWINPLSSLSIGFLQTPMSGIEIYKPETILNKNGI